MTAGMEPGAIVRWRPGKAPLLTMTAIGVALVSGGLVLAFWLSAAVGYCVLFYLGLSAAYSLWLKRKIFIDVIVLAVLYSVRVAAGAAAVSVALSHWLVAFCIFTFLALALTKRQKELHASRTATAPVVPTGRAYHAEDLAVLTALGAASSFASVVVLALYIQSEAANGNYSRPEFLWPICPLVIYWLGRLTLLANRGTMSDDPVVYAARDRVSWLTAVGILAAFAAAL